VSVDHPACFDRSASVVLLRSIRFNRPSHHDPINLNQIQPDALESNDHWVETANSVHILLSLITVKLPNESQPLYKDLTTMTQML
ncbi:hypothetical protein GX48_03745, partial [Paracoccidioides brasiliensis]